MNPILKLWEIQKELAKVARTIRKEDCGCGDALEFLLDDIHKLRGRLMQVGARDNNGKEIHLMG